MSLVAGAGLALFLLVGAGVAGAQAEITNSADNYSPRLNDGTVGDGRDGRSSNTPAANTDELRSDAVAVLADSTDHLNSCGWRTTSASCDCITNDCGALPNHCGYTVACPVGEAAISGGCRISGDSSVELLSSRVYSNSSPLQLLYATVWWGVSANTGWSCEFDNVDTMPSGWPPVFPTIEVTALCCG